MRSGDRGGWVARSQPVLGTHAQQRQGNASGRRDVANEIEIALVVKRRVDCVAEDALYLAESSSAALRTASHFGLLILSQYGDRPEI